MKPDDAGDIGIISYIMKLAWAFQFKCLNICLMDYHEIWLTYLGQLDSWNDYYRVSILSY